MKKFTLITLIVVQGLCSSAQNRNLLKYFIHIKVDSIIDTRYISRESANLCSSFEDENVSDSITLKYFFGNKPENLYFENELYNSDENTYSYETLKKIVCPLFLKTYEGNSYLLCYEILNIMYLSFYDAKRDILGPTYEVGDYSHYVGEQMTSSIVFPNGYIASIEITDEGIVYYRLLSIDLNSKSFNLIKSIEINGQNLDDKEKNEKLYPILGINEKGELIK